MIFACLSTSAGISARRLVAFEFVSRVDSVHSMAPNHSQRERCTGYAAVQNFDRHAKPFKHARAFRPKFGVSDRVRMVALVRNNLADALPD